MLSGYPDRIQPLGWALLGAALAVGLAIAATWLLLHCIEAGPPRDRTLRFAQFTGTILVPLACVCIVMHLLVIFVQGGSAINTERFREPGQYLLQNKDKVWEVSRVEFVVSWVLGYGCTVGAIFAGGYGAWLRW